MIKVDKKVIARMNKCYAICLLESGGEKSFLVATEKEGDCRRFDIEGNPIETIWTEPGGVMTMVQIPNGNGAFLSTQKFYSPNNSSEAKIVIAEPIDNTGKKVNSLKEKHTWRIKTLCQMPYIHRFDIIPGGNKYYIIACTIKSDHKYKDDWRYPGKIWVRELPESFDAYDADAGNPMEFDLLQDGLLKNHGYGRFEKDGKVCSLIGAENGLFKVSPPNEEEAQWQIKKILDRPTSDVRAIDIDGDGKNEYMIFSPFHGSDLSFYKESKDGLEAFYHHSEDLPFLHALWAGEIKNKASFILGHRGGDRDLMLASWNDSTNKIEFTILDHDRGPANVLAYNIDGQDFIVATNRETNEVALYKLK